MYTVIRKFKDTDGHIYKIGDSFPRDGVKKPTQARIKVLSTNKNQYEQIYIEKNK